MQATESVSESPTSTTREAFATSRMDALSGIRFFAILHIFLFHLWAVFRVPFEGNFKLILIDFVRFPETMQTFFANGWMSTSFFFLLSGFMLAYIYWGEDGKLTVPVKKFYFLRFTRIYPVHILVMIIMIILGISGLLWFGDYSMIAVVLSAFATLGLVQAWFPPLVPIWSWPAWNISAVIFLYLIMPWLMPRLASLSKRQMSILLGTLPFISLVPTLIYSIINQYWFHPGKYGAIFLTSTPVFWIPHFIAGMLLTRVFSVSRFNPPPPGPKPWFALGDLCLIAIIVLACTKGMDHFPHRHFLRHGTMMPLYLMVILDLARGHGIAARIFSLPGMNFLGETGFSIFIWQVVIMSGCFISLNINPALALNQLWFAVGGVVVIAILSTYLFEKPFQNFLRKKYMKKWIN